MKNTFGLVTLAAALLFSVSAQAENKAFVGLSGNYLDLRNSDSSDTYSQVGIYGGYRFENIGIELSYTPYRKDGYDLKVTDLAVVPLFNIAKDVNVLVKLGVRYATFGNTGVTTSGLTLFNGGENALTGTSALIGAGVEYQFNPNVAARAVFDYSNSLAGVSTDTKTFMVGVQYQF